MWRATGKASWSTSEAKARLGKMWAGCWMGQGIRWLGCRKGLLNAFFISVLTGRNCLQESLVPETNGKDFLWSLHEHVRIENSGNILVFPISPKRNSLPHKIFRLGGQKPKNMGAKSYFLNSEYMLNCTIYNAFPTWTSHP